MAAAHLDLRGQPLERNRLYLISMRSLASMIAANSYGSKRFALRFTQQALQTLCRAQFTDGLPKVGRRGAWRWAVPSDGRRR